MTDYKAELIRANRTIAKLQKRIAGQKEQIQSDYHHKRKLIGEIRYLESEVELGSNAVEELKDLTQRYRATKLEGMPLDGKRRIG